MQWFRNHPGVWHMFNEVVADDPSGKQLVKAKCGNVALVDYLDASFNQEEVVCTKCNRRLEEPSE